MKKNTTRSALFTSVLALLLCVSMLVGTTFAWFTDSVTSANNIIKSGNLDIDVMYDTIPNGTYEDSIEDVKDLFVAPAGATKGLWEPGHTEVAYLKVVNNGTLALKYQFMVDAASEVIGKSVEGNEIKLSEILKFAATEPSETAPAAYDRATAEAAAETADGNLLGYTTKTKTLAPGAAHYIALVVYMPETTGNEANYRGDAVPTINFKLTALATQVEAENDSFDNTYDEGAWIDGFDVFTAQELQTAINAGETAIDLMANIETAESVVIPEGAAVKLNLNGKTLSGAGVNAEGKVHTLLNNGTLTLENGAVSSNGTNGGSAIYNNGVLTMENVTVNGAPSNTATGTASYAVNTQGANSKLTITNSNITGRGVIGATEGTKVEINGGTYHAPAVAWGHAVYANGEGTEVVINGGTFSEGWDYAANLWGMYQIYSGNKAKVTVNGGDFSQAWDCANGYDLCTASEGVIEIYGGTFAEDPSSQNGKNFIATDYKVVKNNGLFYVVANTIANVVGNAEELKTALSDAADAGSDDNTLYLTGDINLTGSDWTPIKVDGYHGAGVITIEGNGATITGLNAPLFAGGFGGKSGIVIKNLTIADSNIAGGNQGGGAFIDCADSMHVITLENCHLINSTVSGERAGGLIGWCSGYAKLNDGPVKANVTISNCSVVDSTVTGNGSAGGIAGHPGASDYTYTTIENCVVKNVKVISHEPVSSWRTGAIVGTANNGHVVINNVAVENVTLTQDGVTAEKTKLYGRFVPSGTGTLVIDGKYVVETAEQLTAAVANGETNILLADGEYNVNGCGGKTLTISGSKNAVLKVMNEGEDGCDYGFGGSGGVGDITFNGVTIDTTANTGNYKGYSYMKGTFNDCNFVGAYSLNNTNDFVFNRCTFDFKNGYFWTWAANSVTFDGCTFTGNSKTILAHGSASTVININNCTFAATEKGYTGSGDNTAVVEMDPIASNTYTIRFTGTNTKTDSYAGWTGVKDGSTGHVVTGQN